MQPALVDVTPRGDRHDLRTLAGIDRDKVPFAKRGIAGGLDDKALGHRGIGVVDGVTTGDLDGNEVTPIASVADIMPLHRISVDRTDGGKAGAESKAGAHAEGIGAEVEVAVKASRIGAVIREKGNCVIEIRAKRRGGKGSCACPRVVEVGIRVLLKVGACVATTVVAGFAAAGRRRGAVDLGFHKAATVGAVALLVVTDPEDAGKTRNTADRLIEARCVGREVSRSANDQRITRDTLSSVGGGSRLADRVLVGVEGDSFVQTSDVIVDRSDGFTIDRSIGEEGSVGNLFADREDLVEAIDEVDIDGISGSTKEDEFACGVESQSQ